MVLARAWRFRSALLISASVAVSTPLCAQSLLEAIAPRGAQGVERGSTERIPRVSESTLFVTFDTFGSEDIGRATTAAAAAIRGTVHESDQLDIAAVLAGPFETGREELLAFGGGYAVAAPIPGLEIYASGDWSRVALGSTLGRQLGVRVERWRGSAGVRHNVRLGDDAALTTALETTARGATGETLGATSLDEDLRLVRLSFSYSGGWESGHRHAASVTATHGLRVLGASAEDNPFASRPGATPNFVSIGANVSTSYRVFGPIMLRNGFVAQWSPDNLPFSQRCGFGTNSFSRAFDRSFVNGDSCLGARQEVAALLPAERLTAGLLRFGEVFVAGDGGILWNVDPIDVPERDGWASLYSGVRAAGDSFIAELSISRILDQPDGSIPQDETRIWFRAAARF